MHVYLLTEVDDESVQLRQPAKRKQDGEEQDEDCRGGGGCVCVCVCTCVCIHVCVMVHMYMSGGLSINSQGLISGSLRNKNTTILYYVYSPFFPDEDGLMILLPFLTY